jgi:hypothetical protein
MSTPTPEPNPPNVMRDVLTRVEDDLIAWIERSNESKSILDILTYVHSALSKDSQSAALTPHAVEKAATGGGTPLFTPNGAIVRENEALRDDVDRLRSLCRVHRETGVALAADVDALRQQLTTLERELAEVKAELFHLSGCHNDAEAQLATALRDKERIDFLQSQLVNMDSSKGGTWLRIGDKGRIQVYRIHPNRHPGHIAFVWDEDECLMDSITEHGTNDIREAIRVAKGDAT